MNLPVTLPLGVCALPLPAPNAPRIIQYPDYVNEILAHAGVCHEVIPFDHLTEALDGLKILVTVGEGPFSEALQARLARWVREDGGFWISIGGLCGLGELLGADYAPDSFTHWGKTLRSLGEGFLETRGATHPLLADLTLPLHFFGGIATVVRPGATILAGSMDAHHRPVESPALIENVVGKGKCLLIAPDLIGSVIRIQQGRAVLRDGIPAPDGTGSTNDGVLKSDDGQVLDWLLDREEVSGAPGFSAFLQPIADQWRGLLLRSIFMAAQWQKVALPVLWYHPDGLDAVGHISHDTDFNDPDLARCMLGIVREAGIQSTWCIILPGYEPDLIDAIRADGHELAVHFDAMTEGCPWGESYFDAQWRRLCEMFGPADHPITNKNHYLRWEGDSEFWEWCIPRGIQLDQSKGASKTGAAGFNFGTCHLYRPVDREGTVLPIWEMATPTFDLHMFAPEIFLPPLLDAVLRHYGFLHLLFHPWCLEYPGVAEAIKNAVRYGNEKGLQWRTGRQIVEWETARREASWQGTSDAIALTTPDAIPGATLLVLASTDDPILVDGVPAEGKKVDRWGFSFHSIIGDLAAGATIQIQREKVTNG